MQGGLRFAIKIQRRRLWIVHAGYLDNPEMLAQETTTEDGNSILGHIFGSKDVSRAVAGQAAERTSIGADILKKMLPVILGRFMGGR